MLWVILIVAVVTLVATAVTCCLALAVGHQVRHTHALVLAVQQAQRERADAIRAGRELLRERLAQRRAVRP